MTGTNTVADGHPYFFLLIHGFNSILFYRSVTIEKCRNTTIVLGPVETTIYLSHCEKVTLIAPCRNVMIRYKV
jgi:hypothetical protein